MWTIPAAAGLGFILDLIFGDPHFIYHPVQIIGKFISTLEKLIRRIFPENAVSLRIAGGIEVILVTIISTGIPAMLLYFLYHRVNFYAGFLLETFWCYQMLAVKSLRTESMKVFHALSKGDLEEARRAVQMIVGRDAERLDEGGVTRAAVETVAENTSDGIVAPLLFMLIGGAPAAFFYKSVNTMDSMIGYKNDRYRYFGTAAAKLDDILNFIPARVAAWLMIFSAALLGKDARDARRIYLRDRFNHSSPNSAQTEAVMAGALGVQLAGDAWYFGKLLHKKTIGDAEREIQAEDIRTANRIALVTAVITLVLFGGLRILFT